jgi:ABC-2 type transport system ATP-binding protein
VPTIVDTAPIVVRNLRKRYGRVWALQGVDLSVEQGEVFAFLGPNGAGKTSLVDIATGARRATSGEVRVLGCDPADDSRPWRARIGVVPQNPGAFADLTVREVVAHFAAMYPAPMPVAEALDLVDLTGCAGRLSHKLSGGQQRRLDIAVGIVGNPELVFLDEPTTGLDPVARRAVWDLVKRFNSAGQTTVLTTHYLDEVEALADRAAILVGGRVVRAGPLGELGGTTAQTTTVSFKPGGPLAGRPLPHVPGVHDDAVKVNGVVRLSTRTPTQAVAALTAWAGELGADELPDLQLHRPTLEEVYLTLVRDHAGGEATNPDATGADR